MTTAARRASREEALAKLVARFGEGDACRGRAVTAATLKQGAPLLADATLEDEGLSLRFDALKRADGASKLGDHHYLPVLHNHGDKVGRQQKLLLAVLGLALARVQGLRPAVGLVARGPEARLGKVRLDAKLYRQAEQVLDEVKRLQAGGEPPRLTLNRHCQVCEFRQRCRKQAEEADDISLLGGVGEKELQRYQPQGHLHPDAAVLHLPPAEEGQAGEADGPHPLRRLAGPGHPREEGPRLRHAGPAPQAGAGLPRRRGQRGRQLRLPARRPRRRGRQPEDALLLGGRRRTEEVQAFDAFLDLLDGHEDFALFHYGSYEKKLLRRMRKVVKRKELVDRALANAVNVLSAIHASVYFPTFSNGLKDVGRYLGCTWTEENASGLQSLVWRARWEQTREPVWKDKLLTYNAEDCAALKKVDGVRPGRRRGRTKPGRRGGIGPGGPGRRLGGRGRRPVEPPGVVPRRSSPSRTSTTSTAVPTSTTRGRRSSSAPARRSGGPA